MNFTNITVKDDKIFVTASSQFNGLFHHLYAYDLRKDYWQTLPVLDHRDGISHIVGGKLVMIGGYQLAGYKGTNKVSIFDEASQTWTSHYPA